MVGKIRLVDALRCCRAAEMDLADGGASGGIGVMRPLLWISACLEVIRLSHLDSTDESDDFLVGPPFGIFVCDSSSCETRLAWLFDLTARGLRFRWPFADSCAVVAILSLFDACVKVVEDRSS